MAKKDDRATRTRKRIERVKRLVGKNPSITVKEIAARLNIDVQAVYRDLRALGIEVQAIKSGTQANADELDLRFARYAFGKDYENPVGEQDDEYRRECERIGYPGFFYVGELWSIYRDFWDHKRRGLTFASGKWRKATAYDGSHSFDHDYGAVADRATTYRTGRQQKIDRDWDDFEDWF